MSPSNSKLSPNHKTTSCIKNGKRSFLRTSENNVTDDFYYKRKKSTKHSQVEINNAVLTAPNGYIMTRNKLKKQLTSIDNSELVETSVIENKCPKIDNIRNKSEKAIKNRKPSNKSHSNKLRLGFVFNNDISSPYYGKRLDTNHKKSTPSLFESDSDPEIDYFQIKDSIESEAEEISTCISYPDDMLCTAFDKNVEMRTYFNKKSYPINNKSNIPSLNTFEKINQKPSRSFYNHVKMVHDSNPCNSISQNNSKTKKSLKVTDPTSSACVQTNTEDDDVIIVTESFIRQLKDEDEIIKTESQGEIRTKELFYDNNTNKPNDSDIKQHKDNEVASKISSDFEVNQMNMCTIDTNIDNICDINFKLSTCSNSLLKQDMDVIDEFLKFSPSLSPSPFKTTNVVENSLMSIFDVPKESIVESYANINNSLIIDSNSNISTTISEDMMELSNLQTFEFRDSNSDQSIENHPKSENKSTCHLSPDQIEPDQYFHTVINDEIKIKKTESFNNKRSYNCLLKNNILSPSYDSYSKKYNNSKCYCKNFASFNNDDNKIFTSKIKHFAFNNNAKKNRQKILRKKHLEANILNMLINKEHKNIIQSGEHKPIFNSILIDKKYEKCIESKENDHIAPSVLSILKDVYVGVEYLTENCDYNTTHKLPEPLTNKKDIKFNIQASNIKPLDIMRTFKNDNDSTSNNTSQNKPNNLKLCDEKYNNFNKNKIIDNVPMSNITTIQKSVNFKPCDKNYFNFSKNKIIDDSKTNIPKNKKTVNIKPCDGIVVNLNKILDNVSTSNTKQVNLEPYHQSHVNFNKNYISDNASTSNNKPNNLKPCEYSDVNLDKLKIIDHASTSKCITKNKPFNPKSCNQSYINYNKNKITNSASMLNSTTKNKSINPESCEDHFVNLNKSLIIDNVSTSNNKSINLETCDQSYVNFNKNKISDSASILNSITKNKPINLQPYEENCFIFNKNVIIDNVSTSNSISVNLEPCDQSYINFNKNEINYPIINSIEKNDFNSDIVCNSYVGSTEIDTKSKIKVEDDFIYDTTTIKYNFESEKNPVLEIKPFEICHLSDSTIIINENNDSEKEFKIVEKYNDNESENILSLAKIKTNHELTQTKITNVLKDEHKPALAIIESEKEINISTLLIEPPQYKNLFDSSDTISSKANQICPMLPHISENNAPVNNLFDLPVEDILFSLNNNSSDDDDDDNRLLIEDNEPNHDDNINKNSTCIFKLADSSKDERTINCLSSAASIKNFTTEIEFCENKLINQKKKQSSKINLIENKKVSNPILPKESSVISNNNCDNTEFKEQKKSLDDCMSFEMCNEFYKIKSLQKNIVSKNESLPEYIQDILKEVYVDELFVSTCQHMVDLYNEDDQLKNDVFIQTDGCRKILSKKLVHDIKNTNNVKSNMKIRIHLREFILSNKPLDKILESKEFRNLRFFSEEEIARENYDQLNNEEKNKILASTNLNITCPKIMMLTSITLALVKMLRSDTLIDFILNVIRRNVLKKHMNTAHTIDDQLIKQVVYFVDICVRLRLLKTLQIFIFDSMTQLLSAAMSFLIAKKKLYSEETVGCDIFQRELINLLSCHFNYTFSIDMPTNFIQHIHKPDFFVSVVMFLKCSDPKDLVEFIVNCLFPMIDNYLNTQQNEVYAIQTMESINMAIKPFKITCNTTVATYLKKCKDPINGFKKNGKEHVYNTIYNNYKILQNKFIEYLNDSRPRSQYFEELLISIILVLGSVDYLTSCICLMQWKPKLNCLPSYLKKLSCLNRL
ncbi:hypothetical protein QTP88_028255 [Uroleucon formosanum]